jgi:glucosamine--fructose-6-phosphate aminotransferase (isomerizing)
VSAGERSARDIAEQPSILARVVDENEASLRRAQALLHGARAVRFCGIGSSRHAAGYGAFACHAFASVPGVVLPAPGTRVALPLPRRNEPIVIVSQSGRTPSLVDVAKAHRDAGVDVVAATNERGSPLEDVASVTLACGAGAERVVAATKSVSAQCVLLRALALPAERASARPLADALDCVLALDVGALASAGAPSAVVMAGFAADWIAREIALKFVEMCGTVVTSGSVVEHFHGPKAGPGRVLALLDPSDPNSMELAAMPDVTTVGPRADFDVVTPSLDDPSLDALTALVAGQHIAHAVALAIGEDPDASRGLSKVTETR